MSRLKRAMKNAFAVDASGPAEPTQDQREVVDRICKEAARRRLTTPALLFLEMSRPLNYLGSQVLHFFQPMVSAVVDARGYEQFAGFLEHRGSIEYICQRLEHFEHERLERLGDATTQSESGGRPTPDNPASDR